MDSENQDQKPFKLVFSHNFLGIVDRIENPMTIDDEDKPNENPDLLTFKERCPVYVGSIPRQFMAGNPNSKKPKKRVYQKGVNPNEKPQKRKPADEDEMDIPFVEFDFPITNQPENSLVQGQQLHPE